MVSSEERRRLEAAYRARPDARAILCRCAIGLAIIVVIAAAAALTPATDDEVVARVSAPRAELGR